ncbi:hypothetical protein D3C87_1106380 [compost metagenome]
MNMIKSVVAKIKPFAKVAGYAAGAAVVGTGAYIAYQALKAGGAGAAAEAVGAVADAATDAVTDAVAAAFRG